VERIFQILAVVLAGIAAFFLWQGNGETAFIVVVLGAVSFFLSIRFQVKERIKRRDAEMQRELEEEEPE
jgi:pilus assembly protein TadC